jgi:hypothetical protein
VAAVVEEVAVAVEVRVSAAVDGRGHTRGGAEKAVASNGGDTCMRGSHRDLVVVVVVAVTIAVRMNEWSIPPALVVVLR